MMHASAGHTETHSEKNKNILKRTSDFRERQNYYYSNVQFVFLTLITRYEEGLIDG